MANERNIMDILVTAIETIVNHKTRNLPYDRTYIGVVRKVVNGKTFQVEYDGAVRKFVTKHELNLTVGTIVHIVHPSNNINAKFLLEDIKHPS